MLSTLNSLFIAAVLAGTPLLLGALGEILTEKAGNLNLGVEGMMFMGAITGLAGSYYYEQAVKNSGGEPNGVLSALIALVTAFLAGSFGALIYSFLTISLRANQNVTGLTLTIFGTGFGNFFGEFIGQKAGGYVAVSSTTKAAFSKLQIPVLSDIPVLGRLLFQYNWLVYLAIALAIFMAWFFRKSRVGLNLRAVGEDPATADAAGIDITKYKYAATIIGGGICGIGGMYMSMVTTSGVWVHGCVTGYGWLAVALVIFATWSPARGMLVALIFGGLTIMRMYINIPGLPVQIYDMVPYVATILVLVITSMRQSKEHAQPKSCGLNYFREER
ncbi:ABC transporter permease [Blautia schinkii]|nr:ABC transporter permease [Blautia schinkii]